MDETLEHKIRGLKLKILQVEKELAKTRHNVQLGAWLGAGHAKQMAKAGERERIRLEAKLADLRAQLHELAPDAVAASMPPPPTPEPAGKDVPAKPPAVKTAAKVKTPAPEKKKAAAKKPAASKSVKTKKK